MRELKTARLILRPFTMADIPAYAAIRDQPEVARFLLPRREGVSAEQVATESIAVFERCWREQGYGPWAAVDAASGRLIGHHGLRLLPEFGETEILYAFDRAFWGRGLAIEGAIAARDYGFTVVGLARLIAIALPDNHVSRKVMTKAGLTYRRMARFRDMDVAYHALDRAEWQAAPLRCG
jgi:[ribosomal protein S5]-alanine N-acetyltransferase